MRKKYEKSDIISISENLIRERGYHNTGINDILKEAGIPKGSFYNFFVSKEDLGVQVLDAYGEATYEFIKSYLTDTSHSPLQRLKRFYAAIIEGNKTIYDCRVGCLVNNMAMEMGGLNETFAAATDKQFTRWIELFEACIAEGQEAGEITKDYSANELAHYLHTGIFGALSRMKSTRSIAPLELWFNMSFELLSVKKSSAG